MSSMMIWSGGYLDILSGPEICYFLCSCDQGSKRQWTFPHFPAAKVEGALTWDRRDSIPLLGTSQTLSTKRINNLLADRMSHGNKVDMVESGSLVSWAWWSQDPWWAGHGGVRTPSEQGMVESGSLVSRTWWSQDPWWARHGGVRIPGEQGTVESGSSVSRAWWSLDQRWAGILGVRIPSEQDTE